MSAGDAGVSFVLTLSSSSPNLFEGQSAVHLTQPQRGPMQSKHCKKFCGHWVFVKKSIHRWRRHTWLSLFKLFINTFGITKYFIILDLALRMTHTKNISDFKVPHSSTVNIWTRSTFHHCNGHTKAYLQLTSFILECNSTINRILGLNIAGIVNAVQCHSQLLVRQQWLLRNQGFNCLKWQQFHNYLPLFLWWVVAL